MRQRVLVPLTIVALLLISIAPLSVSSTETVITNDITWSENQILSGNITIAQGASLTISPGVIVDGGDGYRIAVSYTHLTLPTILLV